MPPDPDRTIVEADALTEEQRRELFFFEDDPFGLRDLALHWEPKTRFFTAYAGGRPVANAGVVVAYGCTGGENQQWRIEDAGDGWVHVISRRSNKCLNVTGASLDEGAPIIQWTCGPDDNSTWRFENVEGGWTRIVARHSNMCLALADAPDEDGLLGLVQTTCGADTRQHFLRTAF